MINARENGLNKLCGSSDQCNGYILNTADSSKSVIAIDVKQFKKDQLQKQKKQKVKTLPVTPQSHCAGLPN